MRHDVQCYERFQQHADEVLGVQEVVQRSAMGHIATQQIVQVVAGSGYEMVPSTKDFLQKCHARLLGSQVVEDGFNVQKNATPTAWQNRRGTARASYKALIEQKPLSVKHRFRELGVTKDPACRDMKLPPTAFKVVLCTCLQKVVLSRDDLGIFLGFRVPSPSPQHDDSPTESNGKACPHGELPPFWAVALKARVVRRYGAASPNAECVRM